MEMLYIQVLTRTVVRTAGVQCLFLFLMKYQKVQVIHGTININTKETLDQFKRRKGILFWSKHDDEGTDEDVSTVNSRGTEG